MPDLPDYTKRQILIIDIDGFPQEVMVDHRKILGVALKTPTVAQCLPISIEHVVQIDHQQIKGLTLKDPTVELSVPISWEGPYLAYEPCIDAWKVKIVEWAVGTLAVDITTDTLGGLKIVEKNATGLKVDLVTDTLAGLKIIEKLAAGVKVDLTTDTLAGLKVLEKNATGIKVDLVTDTLAGLKVTQATRTNLKVQPEREDVLTKSFDLTVGTTSLLAAVASQYHKVYGWDYEADTDGANEFSSTISGAACKFARRVTLGVHAMTLIHPIVCDVNTALSFISAGNTKLSLRYKTEA